MLRCVAQAQVALQVGQEADLHPSLGRHIDGAAAGHARRQSQRRQVVHRGCSLVVRQRPWVFQDFGVVEQLQLTLLVQRQLRHAQALTQFSRRLERLDGRGAAGFASLQDRGARRFVGDGLGQVLRFAWRQRRRDNQGLAGLVPLHLRLDGLGQRLELRFLRQRHDDWREHQLRAPAEVHRRLFVCLRRDELVRVLALESRVDQAVAQFVGDAGEVAGADESIGLIQRRRVARLRFRLTQYAAQQLLYRRAGLLRAQANEDVGEWAIPAFRQRFLGDHELYRASRVGDAELVLFLDSLQPTFLAGSDHDLIGKDALVLQQLLSYPVRVQRLHALPARLGLNQHQWPQVGCAAAMLFVCQLLQFGAAGDRIAQALLPVRFRLQQDRQLDHLLGLQLRRAHAVQYVAGHLFHVRRGGQFHDAAGIEALEGGETDLGAGVVRLVDDQERAAQAQHVGQRIRGRTIGLFQQDVALRRREAVEMLHQRAAGLVNLQPFGLVAAESLHRGNDHHCGRIQRGPRQRFGFVQVHHRHRAGQLQRVMVGMGGMTQRLQGLLADGVAGHQPQDHAVLAAQQVRVDQRHRARCEEGLAAAGGHAQAEVGHVDGEARQGMELLALLPQFPGRRVKRGVRIAGGMAGDEILLDGLEHPGLVVLRRERAHGGTSSAYGVCLNTMPSRFRRGAPRRQAAA